MVDVRKSVQHAAQPERAHLMIPSALHPSFSFARCCSDLALTRLPTLSVCIMKEDSPNPERESNLFLPARLAGTSNSVSAQPFNILLPTRPMYRCNLATMCRSPF